MTEPTIALEVALHLAGILLMTKTNEKNDVLTIITQQDIIILVIIIIAYHKLVYKPKSCVVQATDQNLIWKNVISSYDSMTKFNSTYNFVDFHYNVVFFPYNLVDLH